MLDEVTRSGGKVCGDDVDVAAPTELREEFGAYGGVGAGDDDLHEAASAGKRLGDGAEVPQTFYFQAYRTRVVLCCASVGALRMNDFGGRDDS